MKSHFWTCSHFNVFPHPISHPVTVCLVWNERVRHDASTLEDNYAEALNAFRQSKPSRNPVKLDWNYQISRSKPLPPQTSDPESSSYCVERYRIKHINIVYKI